MSETTVLVVGDALLGQVVRHLLARPDLALVQSPTADEALSLASSHAPRLAVIDLERPGAAGLPVPLRAVDRSLPLVLLGGDAPAMDPPARVLPRGDDLESLRGALAQALAEPSPNGAGPNARPPRRSRAG